MQLTVGFPVIFATWRHCEVLHGVWHKQVWRGEWHMGCTGEYFGSEMELVIIWVVVSNIFIFTPIWEDSNFD